MCISPLPAPSSVVVGWILVTVNHDVTCPGVSECPEVFRSTFEMVIECTYFSPAVIGVIYPV